MTDQYGKKSTMIAQERVPLYFWLGAEAEPRWPVVAGLVPSKIEPNAFHGTVTFGKDPTNPWAGTLDLSVAQAVIEPTFISFASSPAIPRDH